MNPADPAAADSSAAGIASILDVFTFAPRCPFHRPLLFTDGSFTYNQHRRTHLVADAVNGVAENQVLQPAVAVRAHYNQVGMDLARGAHDFIFRIASVRDGQLGA